MSRATYFLGPSVAFGRPHFKQPHGNTEGLSGTIGEQEIVFRQEPDDPDRITDAVTAETFFLQMLAYYGLEYEARLDIASSDFKAYEAAIEARFRV